MKEDRIDEEFEQAVRESIAEAMGVQIKQAVPDMFYRVHNSVVFVTYTKNGALLNFYRMPPFCGDC